MQTNTEQIYKAALKLSTLQSSQQVYGAIVKQAMKLVNAAYGTLFIENGGQLVRVYASDKIFFTIQPRKHGYTHLAFTTRKPILLKRSAIKKIHPEIKNTDTRSDILVPLSYERKSIGVLSVMSKNRKYFSEKELNILKLFGPLAALAIKNAQFYSDTLQALETRDLFISMASHELKTPITTINVYSQLIKRKLLTNQPLETKWVDPLLNEITRLTRLINELLQVNQIKSGELQYDWKACKLSEIVSRAVRDFNLINKDTKVNFVNNLPSDKDIVWADYDKILQVLINILNNAAKFSPKNSVIDVQAFTKDHSISVSIRDHGKGIPKNELNKVFDRFYRGNGNHSEGMGLGLYLTKKIVDEHKGNISIDSQVNYGTTVQLLLPLYEPRT